MGETWHSSSGIYPEPRYQVSPKNKDIHDQVELEKAVKEACEQVQKRIGKVGFPVLCSASAFQSGQIETILSGMKKAGLKPLIYLKDPSLEAEDSMRMSDKYCSEDEVQWWLTDQKTGEARPCLITDHHTSRGWEAIHVVVIALTNYGMENLVMRTIGFCALVRAETAVIPNMS